MIDRDLLLGDLQTLTDNLVDDLRERTEEVEEIRRPVRRQYKDAREAGRTDRSYEEWREDLLAQVAVGWVLATVFVRFCEDNGLYAVPLLSGPGDRRDLAGDHRADWLADHPAAADREWLKEVFSRYREIPVASELFNPPWQFGPSADGARAIVELWQRMDEDTGRLRHDFTDPDLDTRFLGDLYQDLSEHAKETYALLQTPEFVEEFILDRTLDPAIETFGLDEVKMIDPACGSGHFLLGAFDRILALWREREPGTPIRELVQRTLDAVNGVDLNPFAVEIARFRLLVAALKEAGIDRLADAPVFQLNIAVGDSLLHGRRGELFTGAEGFDDTLDHRYPTEDEELANRLLESGQYHAVVGNPPYITVKDKAARDAYRALYETAWGHYSLAMPFIERLFDLAVAPNGAGSAGFVGMITANSFMKRQFGRKMIEELLPTVDLTHIVDTSGAFIPGHGTPTVILFARHQPRQSSTVRAVLGKRGEREKSESPSYSNVWRSIVQLIDSPGSENDYVSVEEALVERFQSHPWSLQGGAAPKVKLRMEKACDTDLGAISDEVGYGAVTRADQAYRVGLSTAIRQNILRRHVQRFVAGEEVRDWSFGSLPHVLWPYSPDTLEAEADKELTKYLWPLRPYLSDRVAYGKSQIERGLEWWEYSMFFEDRFRAPYLITFAFVSTHNHFVLNRDSKVFHQSAPIVKLKREASEADYLEAIGFLNSSAACFWMKQVFHSKGEGGGSRVAAGHSAMGDEAWKSHYELDSTKLKQFPIPSGAPFERARELDSLAQELTETLPSAVVEDAAPSRERLSQAREEVQKIRSRMVALQEELDWECYQIYGLTEKELTAPPEEVVVSRMLWN